MADCHTRPPHCIALNKVCQVGVALVCRNDVILQGSRGVSHPGWAYDLFLTAAPVDGIKVWDLRTNRWVWSYVVT